jgi:hypothetical protein
MVYASLDFIKRTERRMLHSVITIPIEQILCDSNNIRTALANIGRGNTSYSGSKPLDVYYVNEGRAKGRYILTDGHHRLCQKLLYKAPTVEVFIDEIGPIDECYSKVKTEFIVDVTKSIMDWSHWLHRPYLLIYLISSE